MLSPPPLSSAPRGSSPKVLDRYARWEYGDEDAEWLRTEWAVQPRRNPRKRTATRARGLLASLKAFLSRLRGPSAAPRRPARPQEEPCIPHPNTRKG